MTGALTLDELRSPDLAPTLPFWPGARTLGYGRSGAYSAKHRGTFPLPVIELGPNRWVIPTAPLLRFLGIEPSDAIDAPAVNRSTDRPETESDDR